VYDASGGFVNSFETGSLSAGRQSATWDGLDFDGNQMPPGVYQFEIQAVDATDESVAVIPLMRALVTGVSFKDNTAYLMTDLQKVAIEDVIDVSEPLSSAPAAAAYPTTQPNKQLNGGR
jgi:flagellar basal-body rod modification protein FlgD